MKNSEKTLDMIVNLCKNRGFIYPGSEIYGGLANSWDYGPLGVEFKNNVKKAWLKKFVQESPYNVGLDAAILMNPQTWVASGHLAGFSDPLMDCKECKERFRADKVIEDWCAENNCFRNRLHVRLRLRCIHHHLSDRRSDHRRADLRYRHGRCHRVHRADHLPAVPQAVQG